MKKFTSFVLGTVVGAAVGVVAASLLVSDDQVEDVKKKLRDNDKLKDLKAKYDNGTEIVKNQLASFPKSVEDDSELKDFDDIVIDDSKKHDHEDDADELDHAEKETGEDEASSESDQD
jgi:gas vesicle protein